MMNKILVVDDDKLVRWSLEKSLKNEGYDVISCSTTSETIDRIKDDRIDMVIMDLKKPFDIDEIKKLVNTICKGGEES